MKQGDAVEVQRVWASQGRLKPPLKDWFKGYEFVRMEGETAIIKNVGGGFNHGLEVRYPASDVRPAQ